jgi:hypothetical protein
MEQEGSLQCSQENAITDTPVLQELADMNREMLHQPLYRVFHLKRKPN